MSTCLEFTKAVNEIWIVFIFDEIFNTFIEIYISSIFFYEQYS